MNGGLGRLDEFEAARDGEFDDFVEFIAGGKFGRARGAQRAGLKLQIADGRKRGGIAHRRARGIGFGLVGLFVRVRAGLRCGLRRGRLRLTGRRARGDRRCKNRKKQSKVPASAHSPKTFSLPVWISDAHRRNVISYSAFKEAAG